MSRESELTRSEVRALITHYRLTGPGPITDDQVTAWLRDLRGATAGECHAALTAMASHRSGPVTAAEITTRIGVARAHPSTPAAEPTGRHRAREHAQARSAWQRGVRAVYTAMGWNQHPERDLALSVPCRFCRARPGWVCTPMTRDRAGNRDGRDPATRMHLSRLADARATTARATSTAREQVAR